MTESGSTGDTGPTGNTGIALYNLLSPPSSASTQVTLDDVLSDVSVLQQKETTDRLRVLVLNTPNATDIRTKLVAWAAGGFQGNCVLVRVPLLVPSVCSDGVSRTGLDYLEYVSGKKHTDHIATFQTVVPDFQVGYQCSDREFLICVYGIKE